MELSRLGIDLLCHYIPVYIFPSLTLSLFSGTHILYSRSKFLCTNTYRLYKLHRTGIIFKGHIHDPFYDAKQAEKKLAQGIGI